MSRPCNDSIASGRMSKANQFLRSADDIGKLADDEAEVRDAVATLLVHASIAAARASANTQSAAKATTTPLGY